MWLSKYYCGKNKIKIMIVSVCLCKGGLGVKLNVFWKSFFMIVCVVVFL